MWWVTGSRELNHCWCLPLFSDSPRSSLGKNTWGCTCSHMHIQWNFQKVEEKISALVPRHQTVTQTTYDWVNWCSTLLLLFLLTVIEDEAKQWKIRSYSETKGDKNRPPASENTSCSFKCCFLTLDCNSNDEDTAVCLTQPRKNF